MGFTVATMAITMTASAAPTLKKVTPANISKFPIGFSVTPRSVPGGMEYEVVVIRKKGMDSLRFTNQKRGTLARMTHLGNSLGFEGVRVAKKEIQNRDKIRFRFRVTAEESTRLNFVVGIPSYNKMVDGEPLWIPEAATFYYLPLRDFTPKSRKES